MRFPQVGTLLLLDVPWISFYMFSHHAAMLVADSLASRRRKPIGVRWWWRATRLTGRAALIVVICSASYFALCDRRLDPTVGMPRRTAAQPAWPTCLRCTRATRSGRHPL